MRRNGIRMPKFEMQYNHLTERWQKVTGKGLFRLNSIQQLLLRNINKHIGYLEVHETSGVSQPYQKVAQKRPLCKNQ